MAARGEGAQAGGVLGWIERTGNRLPDPAFIFVILIGVLAVASVLLAAVGYSAPHPTLTAADGAPVDIEATSLFTGENIRRLVTEMPATFMGFPPLGYVLVVMLGAGVAERAGLFAAAMRAATRTTPKGVLTPVVALTGMLSNLAVDAGFVVLVPLAGALYAAAGRHPIAGIAAAFAAVGGGFSANLFPGAFDVMLFGITEAAANTIDPDWTMNAAGNWFFIAAMTVAFVPAIWFVTDVVIEPRLTRGATGGGVIETAAEEAPLDAGQRRGLAVAGIAALAVLLLWLAMTLAPGAPLVDRTAAPEQRLAPLYGSLVALFFVLFLAAGWAYGAAAKTVTSHRDVVRMMTETMADLAYYVVIAFAAAHFIAMFQWSNLGLIFAVQGANILRAADLPAPLLLAALLLFAAFVNLFIGSGSAKWALLAPILAPMMMLLGVSPEMTTAAYRAGDSATNIITPLLPYFPLTLTFCKRWDREFGLGSLTATMLPFSLALLAIGVVMTVIWAAADLPLGPAASVRLAP